MSVTVLRFHAGPTTYALAAGSVANVAPARADVPHLAEVLGGRAATSSEGTRTLRVIDAAGRGEVLVDGPLEFIQLGLDEIAPCNLKVGDTNAIMGFARIRDDVVVLLDAAQLVALLG